MTELPPWETVTGWAGPGQQAVERAAAGLDDARLAGPSRLPGWSRGHVLSHLARNADALVNLLTWARTGTEARMYASPTERADGIEAGAYRALPEQLADLRAANQRFGDAAAAVPADRREFLVLSAQGREIPASEVPWLRVREVWLHLVDLDVAFEIDDIPADIAWTLATDVAGWMSSRTQATAELRAEGQPTGSDPIRLDPIRLDPIRLGPIRLGPIRLGHGEQAVATVEGSPQRIAGWLTGRIPDRAGLTVTGDLEDLPRWL